MQGSVCLLFYVPRLHHQPLWRLTTWDRPQTWPGHRSHEYLAETSMASLLHLPTHQASRLQLSVLDSRDWTAGLFEPSRALAGTIAPLGPYTTTSCILSCGPTSHPLAWPCPPTLPRPPSQSHLRVWSSSRWPEETSWQTSYQVDGSVVYTLFQNGGK